MKKKWLIILAVIVACAIAVAAYFMLRPSEDAVQDTTLIVGTPEMNGDFIEGFGNNAYDASIKRILHWQTRLIAYTSAGEFVINDTVVKDHSTALDDAGNKTYTWTIYDDLRWSDGEKITAKDYVFSAMFHASDEWTTAGASSEEGISFVGYDAFHKGESDVFAGVKLIDDYSFSFTLAAEQLPYFYELSYMAIYPSPMHVYAPGCEIISTEEGAKIEGDLLAGLQNVAATERFAPTVVSGPYKFVSFENQAATLEINEYFKGNFEGKKPTIKNIVQKSIPQDTNVDQVISGDVDIVAGVIEGAKIEAAKASETTNTHSYFRNGYGLMAMHCDWGVTKDPNVRWALAYLLDRNNVIDYVLGGYGGTVHSDYGFAQWMYEEVGSKLDESLVPFNLNIEKANEYLDKTEWAFEADGVTPFDASKANAEGTYMRHNAEGKMLEVHHMGTDENDVTNIIEIQYTANAPLAGVKFDVTKSDFNALLDNYYYGYELEATGERYYNTFNLAVTFAEAFDPYYSSYHSDYLGSWENSVQLGDKELDAIIMKMRALDPTQRDEFAAAWLEYQVRWQELMPQIPLYSNEYFDMSTTAVEGLETTPFWTWDYLVCYMSKTAK